MKNSNTFISIAEAAKRLTCTERTLFHVINRGALPIVKHGRRSIIRESDFASYVDSLPTIIRKAA